jgi:hypothetical protein
VSNLYFTLNPSAGRNFRAQGRTGAKYNIKIIIIIIISSSSMLDSLSIAGATLAGLLQSCVTQQRSCVGLLFGKCCTLVLHCSDPGVIETWGGGVVLQLEAFNTELQPDSQSHCLDACGC